MRGRTKCFLTETETETEEKKRRDIKLDEKKIVCVRKCITYKKFWTKMDMKELITKSLPKGRRRETIF